MPSTVEFKRQAANVFLHVLTRCNLRCRHCYINPEQHGRKRLPIERIERWLAVFADRSPGANLVLLGGEPGVGKTRLALEVLEDGHELGFLALAGHAYEDEGAPFIMASEILEEMVRRVPADELRALVEPALAHAHPATRRRAFLTLEAELDERRGHGPGAPRRRSPRGRYPREPPGS